MNGEKRIFPFYKGKYMGVEPIGFSNKKSAQAYMKKIPDKVIYDACFGGEDEYKKKYGYFCSLKENSQDPCYSDKRWIKDMDLDIANELIREHDRILYCHRPDKDGHYNFRESDRLINEFREKYGLYYWIYIDLKEFKKAKSKFYNENVEYREGILDINVKWEDGTITPAPEGK